jgi:hypothetical protein
METTMKNCRHATLTAITWAILTGFPAAQAGLPRESQLNPGGVKPGGGKDIVIGCVSHEGEATSPTFVISDSRSKPPAIYRLDGNADLLRVHVGHTVEIGGAMTPATGTRSDGNATTLKVESLSYISTTCIKYQ